MTDAPRPSTDAPGNHPPTLPPTTGAPIAPAWTPQQPPRGVGGTAVALAVVGIVVGAFLLLAVFAYFAAAMGVGTVLVAVVLAVIPLIVLLLAIRWIDRWEPEPRGALWFAFLWGAGASVAIALIVDVGLQIAGSGGETASTEMLATVVQAPVVEEIAKGLGVLILAFAARRFFDGPVDGIVYAALIAAGFTFTEDVLYFATSFAEEGAGGLAETFLVRGLFSPFAHMMFTACTGFAVGVAVQRTSGAGIVGAWVAGLVPAIALHALWNGAGYVVTDFWAYYLVVQVPLFIGAIALVVLLRNQEARVTRARLEEYAAAGWFLPGEVDWLATPRGRRAARVWARGRSAETARRMTRFTQDATRLALARQKAAVGRGRADWPGQERALLAAITADRQALVG